MKPKSFSTTPHFEVVIRRLSQATYDVDTVLVSSHIFGCSAYIGVRETSEGVVAGVLLILNTGMEVDLKADAERKKI